MKDSPQEMLPKLVHQGDIAKIRQLLDDPKNPVTKPVLEGALIAAAVANTAKNAPIIRLLLEHGANPETLWSGSSVLMAAAMNGVLPVVKLLVEFGANPSRQLGRESALSAAMSQNEVAIMQYLEGLNAKVDPTLALRYAAQHGDLPRAQRALAAGADINAATGSPLEQTPLTAAASRGELKMIQWLLAHEADPRKEAKGFTALYCAVAYGKSLPAAEVLITAGCSLHSAYYEETTLMAAASQGDLAMVKRLIELGADPQARNNDRGMTVLDYAKAGKNKALVAFLAAQGLNAERDTGRVLARALRRTYGGNLVEHSQGIMLNARFGDHKCQFHVDPDRCSVNIFGLRYVPEVFSGKPPDISLGLSKPVISVGDDPTSPAPAAGKDLGLKVYSSLPAKDPRQAALVRFCQRLAPAVRKLALREGEFLHFSGGYAGLVWQGKEVGPALDRLACFAGLLTPLVRPPQPERRLFDREWLIKPRPKSAAGQATHTFGGAVEPPMACPHCGAASNPIIQIDLTDPVLPKNPLQRPSLPVTWCLECGEWEPVFHDFTPATPLPWSAGRTSRAGPVPAPGTDYLPARRMMLVPVPAGKKAGRKSKLGGSPSWVQSDDTPDCPACTKPMAFVLQMASDSRISYADMGLLYAFACPECRTLASLVQSH